MATDPKVSQSNHSRNSKKMALDSGSVFPRAGQSRKWRKNKSEPQLPRTLIYSGEIKDTCGGTP